MDGVGQTEQTSKFIRRLEPLPVAIGYILVTALLYCNVFEEFFNIDDSLWIAGQILGSPVRLTQHILLHRICLPLFGDHIIGYRLLSLGLHAVNAFVIYHLFILFSHTIKSSIHVSRSLLHAGAVMAGLLFLTLDNCAPRWISALANELVVFFTLATLVFALHFFRNGRPLCWIAVATSYGLALTSHSYALALPGFIVLIEICARGDDDRPFSPAGAATRYLALAGILGLYLWRFRTGLITAGFTELEGEPLLSLAGHFFKYLWLVLLQLLPGALAIAGGGATREWIAAVMVCGMIIAGAGGILARGRTIGFAGVFVLFFIAWNGLSFIQTMAAGARFSTCWRYYFNIAGLSVVTAYGVVQIVELLTRPAGRLPRALIPWAAAIGLPAVMLASGGEAGHRLAVLKDLVAGKIEYRHPVWVGDEQCGDLDHPTLRETGRRPGAIKDLRCRDLRKADLSASDLTGADLSGSNLTGAMLGGAPLKGAILEDACLNWADLRRADLRDSVLDDAFLSGADLAGADLGGATAVNARFWVAGMTGASLAGANLRGADMREASLGGADLSRADMSGAVLTWADLRGALLKGTDLKIALLDGAMLAGTDLGETTGLTCGRLRGAVVDDKTKLPDGLDCRIEPTGAPGLSRVLPTD